MPKKFVPDEKFVRAWNKSGCIADVLVITGLSKNYIYSRARELRKKGVQLPYFWPTQKREVDVDTLNKVAEEERRVAEAQRRKLQ